MNNLPLICFENLFKLDSTGQKLWKYWFGSAAFLKLKPRFYAMGAAAAAATPFSNDADKYPPIINNFSPQGQRIDQIIYHPSYKELKKLSYQQEIVSLKYNKSFLKDFSPLRHQISFAIAFYFAQTETGLFCPICMTDALGRVMERHNHSKETQLALEHIASTDLNQLWEGAMFMTEKQGGSDVGANSVQAETENGKWFLTGDKWFCSNADAKVILALARMPGDDGALNKGTKGLGLFLIFRDHPQNNSTTWLTHRLKNKLGVRSMASGEVSLQRTEAFLIGGAGEGFKIMTEMVNMSRIYNAVASLGIVRRSILEAAAFGRERKAFSQSLMELPLWKSSLADLQAEYIGFKFLVFEATRQLDQEDQNKNGESTLLRLITPLAKGLGGKLAVFSASESMELIGGNAYIEEHILPRLLRDAQVLPIWEGTTHIQSLDLIRALQKEGYQTLFKRCEIALSKANSTRDMIASVKERIVQLKTQYDSLTSLSPQDIQREARNLLENTSRTLSLCLLLEATADSDLKEITEAAAKRLLIRPSATSPLAGFGAIELKETDDILLKSILT